MLKFRSILLLILLPYVFAGSAFSQKDYKAITVEDLWENWTFWAPSVYGIKSMNDGKHYTTQSRNGDIVKYNYKNGKEVETLFSGKKHGMDIADYHFNADETKILIETEKEPIYRHSYTAEYFVFDIEKKKLIPLSKNGRQQVASFSPSGDKVAFVRKNNIFIKDLKSGKETQVTDDGEFNKILNGIPDWVYEEEFGFNKAYIWLPDGENLAYIKFDETEVPTYSITMFAGRRPTLAENSLYPSEYKFKYPKAGEANSKVSVHVYNLNSGKSLPVDIGQETDIYIPRIRALKNNKSFAVFRLNRLQNKFDLLTANVKNGNTKLIYSEKNKYYFAREDLDNLSFLEDDNFVMTSERNGYRHLYLHAKDGKTIQQLTDGKWDVTEYLGYDSRKEEFYYQSAEEGARYRAVYKVDLDGNKTKLSDRKGHNEVQFSKNFKYYINFFSNNDTPTFVSLHNSKGKEIRVLRDNTALRRRVDSYGGVNREFFEFKTQEDVSLHAYMVKPPDFDKSKKYPVIVYQYSGPNSQEVMDRWEFGWKELLAQQGALVVTVDPRGTGGRGEEFRKITYLQLGKYETIDLIETAKYLQTLDYVDKDRIGIWGWSYGGFMSTLCMTKGADYYTAGIAVAPVTHWKYYDNIYTERFMRTPQENPDGYEENSPINHVEKLEGAYMLVHGTADDNVHWQNSAELSEALVQAGKQFDQFIYTNRDHSIYGGNTRVHLYKMMLDFWKENLIEEQAE